MATITDTAAETSAASPDALLKAAVSGGKAESLSVTKVAAPVAATSALRCETVRRIDPLILGLTAAGLALGTLLGAGTAIMAMPKADGTGVALAEVNAGLEANRLEGSRLAIAADRLDKAIAALREATDAGRNEAKTRSAGLTEKLGKLETTLAAKVAGLGERIEQAEKDQTARIGALSIQVEKRPVAAAAPAKVDPLQTGTIPETKPKPAIVDTWAVRDVYDRTAMLEDRRRRLIEVAVGGTIPGLGRVDGIERRGRDWVVVTRNGLITQQPW